MPVVGETWYAGGRSPMYEAAEAVARKKREAAFFSQASMGGTGYNAMAAGVADQAEQAKIAAAEESTAAAEAKTIHEEQMAAALDTQRTATTEAQEGAMPWREAGVDALGKLTEMVSAGPGDYTESPGYQFRLEEGQKAIERGAAARGGALSGAAVKAATRYSQDFATQDYDNFLRRYYESMAPIERMSETGRTSAEYMGGVGMTGAAQEAQTRRFGATGMATAEQYGGAARATGTMNAANIMAAYRAAQEEKDYGYAAWKEGEEF